MEVLRRRPTRRLSGLGGDGAPRWLPSIQQSALHTIKRTASRCSLIWSVRAEVFHQIHALFHHFLSFKKWHIISISSAWWVLNLTTCLETLCMSQGNISSLWTHSVRIFMSDFKMSKSQISYLRVMTWYFSREASAQLVDCNHPEHQWYQWSEISAQSSKDAKRRHTPWPQSVHPAADWQKIQKYPHL